MKTTEHYLDNGATTFPKPEIVYSTLDREFRHFCSPKRGSSQKSISAKDRLLDVRKSFAELIGVSNPQRIIFTAGATAGLNLALQAFPWKQGDGLVISAVEHNALSRPARKLARERGVKLFVIPYFEEKCFDLQLLEKVLAAPQNNIRLVATLHASNVIGCVLPAKEIGDLAHQYGAYYLLDASQTAGCVPIDVTQMNVDMLAVPGHKALYGPAGVGALYVSEEIRLNTFMEGGTGNDSGTHVMNPDKVPDSFEVGTIPIHLILAFGAGIRWVLQEGVSAIQDHELQLCQRLLEGMKEVPGVRIYGCNHPAKRVAVVSFNLLSVEPKKLASYLYDNHGVVLRAGYHCAPMAHEALDTVGCGGTVRASIGYFTSVEDVDALISGLHDAVENFHM